MRPRDDRRARSFRADPRARPSPSCRRCCRWSARGAAIRIDGCRRAGGAEPVPADRHRLRRADPRPTSPPTSRSRTSGENSHSAKPLLYKITGVWGNHEGSMLLWVLILALFGAAVAAFGSNLPRELQAQRARGAGLDRRGLPALHPLHLQPVPAARSRRRSTGNGLNPVLQDPGLAFHPPFLYLGYVGFSMAFSFAVAALIEGRIDAAWARWVRPWTLAAWMFLTLGIAMGSWWAYYELGWGGFWFWDPVENASLHAVARRHRAAALGDRHGEARRAEDLDHPARHPHLLAVSLIGTFLVRSGVLTSVHAFAVDPARGIFILAILGVFIGGALTLFAWRAPAAGARRPVRADQPRGRAGPQQSPAHHGLRRRVRRHALSAGARGADRRQASRSARRSSISPSCR